MIGKMARMFPMMIFMGFMMVIISFLVGAATSQTASGYFAQPKAIRETTLLAERAAIEGTGLWLPAFKFLGLGLILGGIVMALRVIVDRLREAGLEVMSNLPAAQRPLAATPPWYGKLMPMVMMIGELILVVALVAGLRAATIARTLFSNAIPDIDAAGAGSAILSQLQAIHVIESWLTPLKFVGIAGEFLAIVMGLSTIVYILSHQTEAIELGLARAKTLAARQARQVVSKSNHVTEEVLV